MYNEAERENVLKGGIHTYSNSKQKVIQDIRSFYRSCVEQKTNRRAKNNKTRNWLKTGKNSDCFKTVLFVDATPGDKLFKMLKDTESKFRISDEFRIKFVTKAGVKLKSVLQRQSISDKTCNDNKGRPCVSSNGNSIKTQVCRKNRVNYFTKCKTCELQGKDRVYYGETARNLHTRSQEHYTSLKNECRNSFMYRHIMKEHKENVHDVHFEWGIIGKFVKPLERQLNEAICIEKTTMRESLNSKKEYFHHNVRKIGFNEAESEHQCNHCSRMFNSMVELQKHDKYIHMRMKCKHCDYISFGERDLKEHTGMKHEIPVHDKYRCQQCGYHSNSENDMKVHTDMKHENRRSHDNVDVQNVFSFQK